MKAIREYEAGLVRGHARRPLVGARALRIRGIIGRRRGWHTACPRSPSRWRDTTRGQICQALDAAGIFAWDGNYYAPEVTRRLGLEGSGGMVRVGAVHYNTPRRGPAARRCAGCHRGAGELSGDGVPLGRGGVRPKLRRAAGMGPRADREARPLGSGVGAGPRAAVTARSRRRSRARSSRGRVVGVDSSEDMIAARAPGLSRRRCTRTCASCPGTPARSSSRQSSTSSSRMRHFTGCIDHGPVLTGAARSLRPGGQDPVSRWADAATAPRSSRSRVR